MNENHIASAVIQRLGIIKRSPENEAETFIKWMAYAIDTYRNSDNLNLAQVIAYHQGMAASGGEDWQHYDWHLAMAAEREELLVLRELIRTGAVGDCIAEMIRIKEARSAEKYAVFHLLHRRTLNYMENPPDGY